ncbi:MAG TPA: VCBS repeat-containing protein [Vicinamibacterales bacterium]|nr:VCBS repeat-containing protein [Vicinamibacterales bacterium]
MAAVHPIVVTAADTTVNEISFSDANGWNQAQYYETIRYPDVNGDSRPDVCGRHKAGVYCAISDGRDVPTHGSLWLPEFTDHTGWSAPEYYRTIQFPDVTGDGKADLCARGTQGILCASSNGSSFGGVTVWRPEFTDDNGWTAPEYYRTIQFPDVNGDGKADLCARGSQGILCALSNGASFGWVAVWRPEFTDRNGWAAPEYYSTIQFADMNGDGKADLCARGSQGILCALSNGGWFGRIGVWNASFNDTSGSTAPQHYSTIRIVGGMLCGRYTYGIRCASPNTIDGSWLAVPRDELSLATVSELDARRAHHEGLEPHHSGHRGHRAKRRGVCAGRDRPRDYSAVQRPRGIRD